MSEELVRLARLPAACIYCFALSFVLPKVLNSSTLPFLAGSIREGAFRVCSNLEQVATQRQQVLDRTQRAYLC